MHIHNDNNNNNQIICICKGKKEGKGLILQALSNKKKEREQIDLLFFIVHHMAMEKKYSRPMTYTHISTQHENRE